MTDATAEHGLPDPAPAGAPAAQVPAIEVEGVSRRFGDFAALDAVSLSIKKGEFFSLPRPTAGR